MTTIRYQRTPPRRPAAQQNEGSLLHLFRELYAAASMHYAGSYLQADTHSEDRKDLQCQILSIEIALTKLPPRQRQAVELAGQDNLTEKEVAQAMGISQQAVNRLLQRAAARLLRLGQG